MSQSLFKVVDHSKTQVVIEVAALTALDVAHHPFLDSRYAYITIKRGPNPTYTIIDHDGHVMNHFTIYESDRNVSDVELELTQALKNFAAQEPIFINQRGHALPDEIHPVTSRDAELPYSLILHFHDNQEMVLDFATKFDRQTYINTKLPDLAN